jgi:hypothetical protein
VTTSMVTPCCRTGTGTKTCTNGVWGVCSAGTPASAETCDGEDDDCDGVADNDIGDVSCGLGACRVTLPACVDGSVSTCLPLAPSSSVDGCNEVDDDCDGAVDEDCNACLHVAQTGDDAAAAASGGVMPFQNVQPAIDYAAGHPEGPTRVCVAAGPACGATATFAGPSGADLRMRNGIDLLGGYESTGWTRCSDSTTRLAPGTGAGVLFADDITDPTVLDGFAIDRFAAADTAGVSVRGATGVMLSNLRIVESPVVTTSTGVNITDGGAATIARSEIDGGRGVDRGIGVRSLGARVHLTENCATPLDPVTGHCVAPVPQTTSIQRCNASRIRGTPPFSLMAYNSYISHAVELESSPGSRIEGSSLCEGFGGYGFALRVAGDATGTVVRANSALNTNTEGPTIQIEACAGAAPRIVDNETIGSMSRTSEFPAIESMGDCHPVIESNREIFAQSTHGRAIVCGASGSVPSRCVISNNGDLRVDYPPLSQAVIPYVAETVAIECLAGACTKISKNHIYGFASGEAFGCSYTCYFGSTGVFMQNVEALVDANVIVAGAPSLSSASGMAFMGIDARNSRALRVQNNLVRFTGGAAVRFLEAIALNIDGGAIDVHSNSLNGTSGASIRTLEAPNPSCEAAGIRFNGGSIAIFRNNRLSAEDCYPLAGGGYPFMETGRNADPTVFENNSSPSNYFYLDEGATVLTASQLNALTDMTTSGSITGCTPIDPPSASSPCTNAGTSAGAPLYDYEGQLRDAMPDIGHDEL